jgi:hypothetical protein
MLTVRRFRVVIPTNISGAHFVPRYEEALLRVKFAAQIPQLQLPVTIDEIPSALAHPSLQWHHFAKVDDEIRRLADAYRGCKDKYDIPAIQSAYPDGIRHAIMEEVEAAERHLEAAAEQIVAPEELLALNIPEATAKLLAANGWTNASHLAGADPEAVAALEGIRLTAARRYVAAAKKACKSVPAPTADDIIGGSATHAPLVGPNAKPAMERGSVSASTVSEIATRTAKR